MKKFALIMLMLTALTGCSESIVGKWKDQNGNTMYVFKKNGEFELIDASGDSLKASMPDATLSWEAINEVEPKQLYLVMKRADETKRMPLGLYKIKGNKLILAEPTTYYNTLGGIPMGVSRFELPKDFSGTLKVFKRL